MKALGLIETRGLLPAIEGADAMLKTAEVELVGRTFAGGGLVTITVTGDVAAVTAAVEAGAKAARQVAHLSLISKHVIPRPHPDMESLVAQRANSAKEQPVPVPERKQADLLPECEAATRINEAPPNQAAVIEWTEPAANTKEYNASAQVTLEHLNKEKMDAFVQTCGLEKSVSALQALPVVKLRKLAREYPALDIAGRVISKANKELLIQKLTGYYERGSRQ